MRDHDPWRSALHEHARAIRSFVTACERISPERWKLAQAVGSWSPAEVAMHVCRAYELGRDAAAGGPGMRLLVSPRRAWSLRTILLPFILATGRFPRGVEAPSEVVPDSVSSSRLTRDEMLADLERVGRQAADGFRAAAVQHPARRTMHAYFGPLSALVALRLLSAHTQHHARALSRHSSA